MRSMAIKSDKKPLKTLVRKCSNIKKKKMIDLKQPIRDTISETISFVIKGKLTPIKPIMIENKFNIINKTSRKKSNCDKMTKNANDMKSNKIIKKFKRNSKTKPKVEIENSKKLKSRNVPKRMSENKKTEIFRDSPKEVNTRNSNLPNTTHKHSEGKFNLKTEKNVKRKYHFKNKNLGCKRKKVAVKEQTDEAEVNKDTAQNELSTEYSFKKQQTIDELLKQVNEEILEGKKTAKTKKEKGKSKMKTSKEKPNITLETEIKKNPNESSSEKNTDIHSLNKNNCDTKYTDPDPDEAINFHSDTNIKVELSSDEEKVFPKSNEVLLENKSTKELNTNKLNETETKKCIPQEKEQKPVRKKPSGKELKIKKCHSKLKTKPKITIMKKRVSLSDEDKKCKTKLFGFWNGPKPHRVASLNALAKVHCLYENETRGNILDMMDEDSKLAYAPKKDWVKSNKCSKIKDEEEEVDPSDRSDSSPMPTRTLRSVPGLRGVGKHWDMHDTSSSSEYHSEEESEKYSLKHYRRGKQSNQEEKDISLEQKASKAKKRCRRRNEIVMDLKDMVVRKRMASLNASAILAASYSFEKRQTKSLEGDDSDSYDGSSDEYFAVSEDEIKPADEIKTEEDRKLIEVHTAPNKKVAVILNQDTDVTITGVYVNSTTRSTHHEGYCSIAGMQYRISATSHTQTAATAVATETLLHSSSSSAQDNNNSDSVSSSSKSYTPLEALSNMQPPPGPGIQHNPPIVPGQQPMGPPQHVLPNSHHQLSPGLRHSCSSAFSSPHSTSSYQVPSGHPGEGEQNYVHGGYYQPAGPLITVSHGGSNALTTHGQPTVTKASSVSEASPTSTTPSLPAAQDSPPPGRSTGGDSSDSEVIITSVTKAKEPLPTSHHSVAYRYGHHQFPAPHPNYSYAYHTPYTYPPAPPPHNPSYPPTQPHDLCYPSYKYVPSYRRYIPSPQYYPGPAPQDLYSSVTPANQNQQGQQMVSASPSSSVVGGAVTYPSTGAASSLHPPPTILETFPAPQPALVETYQPPPPPPHYYSPPSAYGPVPSCYTHSPTRTIPYINTTYQTCPCPMQSCPKNGLTGPLTGNSKRSNITNISKDSMPLPPVALALPLEPNSVTGPPSPARGSAGMPPPPSPAGATYQATPSFTKESQSPNKPEACSLEKKKKARIGKAMVRNNIAAGMQQNTMLLMCNPQTQNYPVKREIESPKEKEVIEVKGEIIITEDTKPVTESIPIPITKTEESAADIVIPNDKMPTTDVSQDESTANNNNISSVTESLPPVVSSVAENVKVKNMKRKMSFTKETKEPELTQSLAKQPKMGSYKCLIRREVNSIKINNGKRKLIKQNILSQDLNRRRTFTKSKKPNGKRKVNISKEEPNNHVVVDKSQTQPEESEKSLQKTSKKQSDCSRATSKSSVTALDNLFSKNSIDRTIERVIHETCLTSPPNGDVKSPNKLIKSNKDRILKKKDANNQKIIQTKNKIECKKIDKTRVSRCDDPKPLPVNTKVPRRSFHAPRWSNGWRWEGEPYESKVFINSDEMTAVRKCYPAMMHETGDKIVIRDCVLLKAGPRKNDLPFVAKIASLWENPEDGEMMMSLLWYYRPEHTEQGRLPTDQPDEVFASRHKDSNSVACIDDKCYVLTFNEYCRYRKKFKRIEEGIEEKTLPCIPNPVPYPRSNRQPPSSQISPEMVFFCRRVYDFRQKRIMKNPT